MTGHDEAGDAVRADRRGDALPPHPDEPKRAGSVRTLRRACLACGRGFEVNPRHADAHRFCSAACRSRQRHRARRREREPSPPSVAEPAIVPVIVTPCRYCADDERGGCEFCGGPVPGRRCAHCAEGVRLAVVAAAVVG